MSRSGVVAALAAEARTLGRRTQPCSNGSFMVGELMVAVSGMGPARAGRAARLLADSGASGLVSWGMAGGLDPALCAGTICLPSQVISSAGVRYPTEESWSNQLRRAIPAPFHVVDGTLLTALRSIDTAQAKNDAFRATGAVAVDMESAAIAEVATDFRLPFIAVRVIVDTASDSLPPAVIAASQQGQVHLGRLLKELLRAPRTVFELARLGLRYRDATRSLTRVAATGSVCAVSLT